MLSLAALVAGASNVSFAAEKSPVVTLDLASTFPGSMPILGDAAHKLSERVKRATGGELVFKFYEPGKLVPAADTVNAVAAGKIAAAWAGAGWFAGKDSAFDFFSSVPFGPDINEYMAWIYEGGGLELAREMFQLNDGSCIRLRPERPNHVWSYDFVADRTHDGKAFQMLCIIDEFSRESLAIRVARKLKATDVIEALCELFVSRGIPAHIRSDNGPEFVALALREWIAAVGAKTTNTR